MRSFVPLLALLPAISLAQECFEEGVCTGTPSLITERKTDDANACLFLCQDPMLDPQLTCRWWNYSPATQDCFLYTTCPVKAVDTECEKCVYGEANCDPVYNCNLSGLCQGGTFGLHTSTSIDNCLNDCKNDDDCNWFSYNEANGYCQFFGTCATRDETLTTVVSGEKLCALGNDEIDYNKVFIVGGSSAGTENSGEVLNVGDQSAPCNAPANFPVEINGGGGGFAGDKVVFCGGTQNAVFSRDCYTYNNVLNTWTKSTSGLTYARTEVAWTKIDKDRFWITGGWGGTNYVTTTEIYDGKTGRFSAGPALPVGRGDHCMVKVSDNQYLFVGGLPLSTKTYMYTIPEGGNFNSGSFAPVADISENRQGAFCGAVQRTNPLGEHYMEVVVAAGYGSGSYGRQTYVYSVNNDQWRAGTAYPESTTHGVAVPYGNTFMAIDGNQDGTDRKSVYLLNINGSTDSWIRQSISTSVNRYYSAGFLIPDDYYPVCSAPPTTTAKSTQ